MTDRPAPWTQSTPPTYTPVGTWAPTGLGQMSALRRRVGHLLASTHHVMAAGVADVLLVVDESTSNALRHGAPPVELQLHCTPPDWLVLVTDHAVDTALAPTSTRDPAQGGMGLTMVARVATATGWQRANGSEQIWAVVPV